MKNNLLQLCLISTWAVFAQNNNASGYTMPDLKKVKHLLPGAEIKPPVKDVKKLSRFHRGRHPEQNS